MHSAAAEALAGSVGGCVATLLGHPLDTLKVRKQADPRATFSSVLKGDGPGAFLRGAGPPLANAALMNSLMFLVFAECRRRLPDGAAGGFVSGAIAGLVTATLSTPFDYVKIQAQVVGTRPLDVLRATLRRPNVQNGVKLILRSTRVEGEIFLERRAPRENRA